MWEKIETAVMFCVRWRFLIALFMFMLGVALQIHGSSIAEYNKMFADSPEYNAQSIILGESRAIRSDEWLVSTPYNMSQAYNDFNKESFVMSIDGQDMVISSSAPVADATLLAQPLMWGYVLLGNDYGLAWYWCGKVILLLLVSFEFCLIITRRNIKVSLVGMMLITFAPAMQWWGMIDAYLWGMVLLVLGYYFFTNEKGWLKNLCTVLLPFAAVAFVLILYPAFQWPTGLFMVTMLVVLLVRDEKEFSFYKVDIWRLAGMVVVAGGILGYTLITSKDAIIAVMNTAYPGAVVALGGDMGIKDLFTDLTNFTLPFKDLVGYSNNCEVSTFVQFAPLFLMLYPIIYKRAKRDKNMIVGNTLVVVIAVMVVFMLAGLPELLAKVTLFSYITRMKLTYGLVATVFTVWGMDMVWRRKVLSTKSILVALAVYVGLYVCFVGVDELTYLDWWQYAIIIAGLAGLGFVILKPCQNLACFGMVLLMIICGCTVNPIARGTAAATGHPLEQKIAEIAAEDADAYWVSSGNRRLASLGLINGAKMLNMVNYYPDYGKWRLVDSEGEYDEIYNRYAHIELALNDDETTIELGPTRDLVLLNLSYEDSLRWPVKYVVSAGALEGEEKYYEEIYKDSEGEYYIYERLDNVKTDN